MFIEHGAWVQKKGKGLLQKAIIFQSHSKTERGGEISASAQTRNKGRWKGQGEEGASSGCEAELLSESSMPSNAGKTFSVPLSLKHTQVGFFWGGGGRCMGRRWCQLQIWVALVDPGFKRASPWLILRLFNGYLFWVRWMPSPVPTPANLEEDVI